MDMEIISWVFALLALTGTILNSRRNKFGFFCWIASNLWMAVTSICAGLIPQGILFFIYLILAIYGIIKWSLIEQDETPKVKKWKR